MARRLQPAPMDSDPDSLLVSEPWAMRYLGIDSKGITTLIKQGDLKRDPLTGAFARAQVQKAHDKILGRIMGDDGAPLGQQQQALGVQPRFRTKPHLV